MGGSSGGGGQGSDPIPDYLKTVHSQWLNNEGVDEVFYTVTEALNNALDDSGNPFSAQVAFVPTTNLAKMVTLYDGLEDDVYDITANAPDPYYTSFINEMNAYGDYLKALIIDDPAVSFVDNVDYAGLKLAIDGLAVTLSAVGATLSYVTAAAVDPAPEVTPVSSGIAPVTATVNPVSVTPVEDVPVRSDYTTVFNDFKAAICEYNQLVNSLHFTGDWERGNSIAQKGIDNYVINDTIIQNDVFAFRSILEDDLETKVIPRFQAGMTTIGAVQSSAYVLGKAVIEAFHERDVAKYETGLREQLHRQRTDMISQATAVMLQHLQAKVQAKERIPHMMDAYGKLWTIFDTLDVQIAQIKNAFESLRIQAAQISVSSEQLKLDKSRIELGYEQVKVSDGQLQAQMSDLGLKKSQIDLSFQELKVREAEVNQKNDQMKLEEARIDLVNEELKLKEAQYDAAIVDLRLRLGELMGKLSSVKTETESAILKPHALALSAYELEGKGQSLRQAFYGLRQDFMRMGSEIERLKIVAGQEEANQNLSIRENEQRWPMEQWQAAANMLAAYSGGTAPLPNKQPGQISSAIGGALSGASVGGELGGGWGAGVGAVLGAASAFL